MGNIIVYGSGWAGIAAAAKAARFAPNAEIHLISPYPVAKLGGISTIGGQNYIDLRKYNGTPVQGGSFGDWYSSLGSKQYYNTDTMASNFATYLNNYSNITVYHRKDIKSVTTANSPYRITGVTLQSITRGSNGIIAWSGTTSTLTCDMFIDASDEGRIARTVNAATITGRYDWPASRLASSEANTYGLGRQQAATLMFKMKNINGADNNDMSFDNRTTPNLCWGGTAAYQNSTGKICAFNNAHKGEGYMLKPINAARNGASFNEWWVNALMVFYVDGRRHDRDSNTTFKVTRYMSNTSTTDTAYVAAKNFINTNKAELLAALRTLPGFSSASFVENSDRTVVTGDTLYIRETVHMSKYSGNIANGTENSNYNLTTSACHNAGATSSSGGDSANYTTRIGVGYYNSDIHPYTPSDCIDANGNYIWGYPSYAKMRSDLTFSGDDPEYPVYIPYSVLKTEYVANLLIPGYAANMSSFAWGELRVFPNQAVLGDAAGVAAAYCHNNSKYPYNLTTSDIAQIQNSLRTVGAKLEKASGT